MYYIQKTQPHKNYEAPDNSDNQNTGDAVAHPAHDPPQFTGYYNV